MHFDTVAIDRTVAHAVRVADSLVGLAPRRPLHVALFVGRDVAAHLMVSEVVPRLIALEHFPFIFLEDGDVGVHGEELRFWREGLLQEAVIPYLGLKSTNGGKCLTPLQVAK